MGASGSHKNKVFQGVKNVNFVERMLHIFVALFVRFIAASFTMPDLLA